SSYPIGQDLSIKQQNNLNITRSLNLGMTGEDVRQLQTLLAQDKTVYPEGKITGYFGPLTESAVQRFQLKYQIVNSAQEQGYGVFGPKTRAKLNSL
ncbi:peptidoglycan-binding protein, partial [Candidatus Nomurabacteria bacterium]|nr:peptidoglycan-binding protein [Candidatus Nomurabacteria bacterium]